MAAKKRSPKLAIAIRHLNRFLLNYRAIYNKELRKNFDSEQDFKGRKWRRYRRNIVKGKKGEAYPYHRILARIHGKYKRANIRNHPADKSIAPHTPKLYVSGKLRKQLQMPRPKIRGNTIEILFPHLEKDLKQILDPDTYKIHRWNNEGLLKRTHHQMSKDFKFDMNTFRTGGKKVLPLLNRMWAKAERDGVARSLVRFIKLD